MIVQHNLSALFTQNRLKANTNEQAKRCERLGSGYKINRAADNAAGLTISEKMRGQIRGLERASCNIQDGISFTQVADGALSEMQAIAQRMQELCVQGANDTYVAADRDAINKELNSLKESLDHICKTTEFNEILPFKSSYGPTITGAPNDIRVWNEGSSGTGIDYAGVWYDGKRYRWDEFDPSSPVGADGNLLAGSYTLFADKNPLVPLVEIPFVIPTDGLPANQITRQYNMEPSIAEGVRIDNSAYSWASMGIDPADPQPGNYSFNHAGMQITFTVHDGETMDDILHGLRGDALGKFEWGTAVKPITSPECLDANVIDFNITEANKNHVGYGVPAYSIVANDTGITIHAADSKADKTEHTFMTWKELGIETWTGEDNKASVDQTKTYTYVDQKTGLKIPINILWEASKEEVIQRLNGAPIESPLLTPTTGTTTGQIPTPPLTSFHFDSSNINFKNQLEYGRDFDNTNWNFNNNGQPSALTHNATGFSITYINNGKTMTFNCSDADFKASLSSSIKSSILGNADSVTVPLTLTDANGSTITFDTNCNIKTLSDQFRTDYNNATSDAVLDPQVTTAYNAYYNSLSQAEKDKLTPAQIDAKKNEIRGNLKAKVQNDLITNSTYSNGISALATSVSQNVASTNTQLSLTTNGKAKYQDLQPKLIHSPLHITTFGQYTTLPPRLMHIQTGANSFQAIPIPLQAVNSNILMVNALNVRNFESASRSISNAQFAVEYLSGERTKYGALQNRMEHAMSNANNGAETQQVAESLIRDADMAEEMMFYSMSNITVESAQAMLAQANASQEGVLSLLK